jgi:exopolysaccharide production protein ExoQ
VFISTNLQYSLSACKSNWILLIIPCWALLSVAWSDVPIIALRGSVQLIITTVIAIVIASRLKVEITLKAIAIAMLIAMLMSLLSPRFALNGLTGEESLIGIFNSKNYLATNTAMAIFVAISLFLNKFSGSYSKFLGVILLVTSSLVLIKAKSFGAVVFVIMAVLLVMGVLFYQNIIMNNRLRIFINWGLVLIFFAVFLFFSINLVTGHFDEFMYEIGKDPTLTGRTYIWERGFEIIEEHPMFGVGYQSLFYSGNNIAEDIWEFASVPSGAGFNFHNAYVNVTVELGFIGLALFIMLLALFFRKIFSINRILINDGRLFSIFIFIYLFLQTFLEASWPNQFTVTHLFICMAWVYLKEEKNES